MRVPGIAWWPGRIKPGVTRQMATAMDLLPTALALAGVRLPSDRVIDGLDMSPLLFEQTALPARPFFYYRGDKLAAVRLGEWKAHFFTQSGYGQGEREKHDPPLLFHLGLDPSEKRNLAGDHPDVIERLRKAVASHQKDLIPGRPQLD